MSRTVAQYAWSLLGVVIAIAVRWALDPWLGDGLPRATVYAAVAFSVWLGGWRPALVASAAGLVACELLFVPPRGAVAPDTIGAAYALVYVGICGAIVYFGERARRSQDALRRSEERLRTTLEELRFHKFALDQSSIVAMTDVAGTITYVNDMFCSISGYSREELIGQNHRLLNSGLHPKEFFREMYMTISRGQVWHGEIRNKRKDGSYYWLDATIVPAMGPDGRPERYLAIRKDITERKLAEARERAAERMAAMGELAAGLGHDLGNLLLPMDARLESLRREPLTPRAAEAVRAIEGACKYLRLAVRGLRNLTMDAERDAPVAVTDLGRWWPEAAVVFKAALPRGVRLEADLGQLAEGELLVAGAPQQIMQVAFNLVQNAGQALAAAGGGGVVRVGASREGGRVVLRVSDTGPGMTDEVRARCMEPFFSTKDKSRGGGFGLSLVSAIVERLRGQIEIESRPGEGTTFIIALPEAADDGADQAAGPRPIAALLVGDGGFRALIEWQLRTRHIAVRRPDDEHDCIDADLCIADAAHRTIAERLAAGGDHRALVLDDAPGPIAAPSRILYTGRKPTPAMVREALNSLLDALPTTPSGPGG